MLPASADVVIVGGGNAALCAALAAAEHGVSVLVLERAPQDEAGGNSGFTAGAMRCVYDGVADLKALMPDLTVAENLYLGVPAEQRPSLMGVAQWARGLLNQWSDDVAIDAN